MNKNYIDMYVDAGLDQITQIHCDLNKRVMHMVNYGEPCERLRRDKRIGPLIKALRRQEGAYSFLKSVLEENLSFYLCEARLFDIIGIQRDLSRLSKWKEKEIIVQSVAQVNWYMNKNQNSTIEEMIKTLSCKNNHLSTLFGLKFNPCTIRKWITKVYPLPQASRKGGRPLKTGVSSCFFDDVILIPNIFLNNAQRINFGKFKFALACVTCVLKAEGWQLEQIIDSKLIGFYTRTLRLVFYPLVGWLICDWIEEAFSEN